MKVSDNSEVCSLHSAAACRLGAAGQFSPATFLEADACLRRQVLVLHEAKQQHPFGVSGCIQQLHVEKRFVRPSNEAHTVCDAIRLF